MTYGKIINGTVDEVRERTFDGAVALPDGVTAGWTYDGTGYLCPAATDAEINAEIMRRIALEWHADDQVDALTKQINAQTRLDGLRGKTLSADQKAERNALKARRRQTRHIRDKGKALKALGPDKRKGVDITDDTYWTGQGDRNHV